MDPQIKIKGNETKGATETLSYVTTAGNTKDTNSGGTMYFK